MAKQPESHTTVKSDDTVLRQQVMWLIEREISQWTDADPPRHALSILWGKVRDMTSADQVAMERIDYEQYLYTVST